MVAPFVLDTSVAIAWCFDDESTAQSRALLASMQSRHAIVPPLWRWEVGNALLIAERRKRIESAGVAMFLGILERLPIRVDEEATRQALVDTLRLARNHRLSGYDAAYLELAVRLDLPLATRDAALTEAARASGISLLPT